jgi:hypothetical protein
LLAYALLFFGTYDMTLSVCDVILNLKGLKNRDSSNVSVLVMMTMFAMIPKVPMAIMKTPERVKARDGMAGLTKYEVGSSMIARES